MGGWTQTLAEQVGGSEAGLKLIIGQLSGYPILLFYRKYLSNKDTILQHVYFAMTGLMMGHWVIGPGVVHSLYSIIFTYLLLVSVGGTILSVVISFSFNLSYLLIGYWYNNTGEEYDISWTMPQCVLCLRLIGLTFDIYDGAQKKLNPGALTQDQLKNCLSDTPSILEMLSHSFFIGGYFVGPQFTMTRFRQFVTPVYFQNLPSSPSRFGFRRLMIGVCYMIGHVVGSQFYPDHWPITEDYQNSSLPCKLFGLMIWVKVILAKYQSMWLMAEGVCVVSGLSYSGKYEDGSANWTGCANVKLRRLETATQFGHYIEAFNINTNAWAAHYIYKRLKFLNNKFLSQAGTLIFLAVWHGWHPGYYLTFLNEFAVMKFEGEFARVWRSSQRVEKWRDYPSYNTVTSIMGWLYVHFFLPHCFLPFPLKTAPSIWSAYCSVFFIHFVFYLGWPLWVGPLKTFLQCSRRKSTQPKENLVESTQLEKDLVESTQLKKDLVKIKELKGELVESTQLKGEANSIVADQNDNSDKPKSD